MSDEAASGAPHIVRVAWPSSFSSPTLPEASIERLQTAFRKTPWFMDRWARRRFRDSAFEVFRSDCPGGLVFVGPGMSFDVPPPFNDTFEPIELHTNDVQLKTLSGPAPTREERITRVVLWIVAITIAGMLIPLLLPLIWGGPTRALMVTILIFAGTIAFVGVILFLLRLRPPWYLLPGAMAIIRRRGRPDDRLVLRTRFDTCAVLRKIHTGKTTVLMLELWGIDGGRWRRAVTDREAISFLAAWQSPQRPPSAERLRELT